MNVFYNASRLAPYENETRNSTRKAINVKARAFTCEEQEMKLTLLNSNDLFNDLRPKEPPPHTDKRL